MAKSPNRYTQLIETIFFHHYQPGMTGFSFDRSEIISTAQELDVELPKNIGDVLYTFRYRQSLPKRIQETAPQATEWNIQPAGIAIYRFELAPEFSITPSPLLTEIKILDATPGVINRYAMSDEQALLAKLRYNRLIDIFTSLTCYSLQNHFRTTVPGIGQIESDEIYIGVNRKGAHFVIPAQAKGGRDKIGRVQIEQDIAMSASKFSGLGCIPIEAQFMNNQVIALFLFDYNDDKLTISTEKHYRLVRPDELTNEELMAYQGQGS